MDVKCQTGIKQNPDNDGYNAIGYKIQIRQLVFNSHRKCKQQGRYYQQYQTHQTVIIKNIAPKQIQKHHEQGHGYAYQQKLTEQYQKAVAFYFSIILKG